MCNILNQIFKKDFTLEASKMVTFIQNRNIKRTYLKTDRTRTKCLFQQKQVKKLGKCLVTGHSDCGKTAIVQHFALRYRRHDWLIKPVDTVIEIKEAYTFKDNIKNNTMFVFNDPIGKESLSEV